MYITRVVTKLKKYFLVAFTDEILVDGRFSVRPPENGQAGVLSGLLLVWRHKQHTRETRRNNWAQANHSGSKYYIYIYT